VKPYVVTHGKMSHTFCWRIFWLIQAICNMHSCIIKESYLLLNNFLTNTGDLMKFLRRTFCWRIFWLIQAIWNIYSCIFKEFIFKESYLLLTNFLTNTGDPMKFLRMQSYLLKYMYIFFEQVYLTIFHKCRSICKNYSQEKVRFILLDSAFWYYVTWTIW